MNNQFLENLIPKVLVVDDNESNLVAIKNLLKQVDVEIITASSGNEALSLLLRHQFALILLDVEMPDMNGFETAELISNIDTSRHIPIIFVTAIEKDEHKTFKGYDLGAVDYLYKPIDAHVLISKVKTFLRLHEQKWALSNKKAALEKTLKEKEELVNTIQAQNIEKDLLLNQIKAQNNKLKKYGRIRVVLVMAVLCIIGSAIIVIQAKTMNNKLTQLNEAYKRFVPYDLLELLEKNDITQIHLGDQILKEMIVMFVDVRGYTTLAEHLTPEENIALINSIFSTLQPAIEENRGIINKYLGDGLMALFPHGSDDAVNAAISMLKNLLNLSLKRESEGLAPIRIGIGLDGGELMLGTVGLEKRMEQTVVADAVNVASRIEGATKFYNATLLISGYVYNGLKEPEKFAIRFIDEVRVQGRKQPTALYQLFDGEDKISLESYQKTKKLFHKGVTAFRKAKFQESKNAFTDVVALNKDDVAAKVYIERSNELIKNGIPLDWSPIRALSK